MKSFPSLLNLGAEARLTGVELLPSDHEFPDTTGHVVMYVAAGVSESAAIAGPAAARFMRDAVAVIHGVRASGHEWFSIFDYVAGSKPAPEDLSPASLLRSLDLMDVGALRVRTHSFDWEELRAHYDFAGVRAVDEWSTLDLLHGLILDLTKGDLAAVAQMLDTSSVPVVDRASHRHELILVALRNWASTYDGPEHRSP